MSLVLFKLQMHNPILWLRADMVTDITLKLHREGYKVRGEEEKRKGIERVVRSDGFDKDLGAVVSMSSARHKIQASSKQMFSYQTGDICILLIRFLSK